MLEADEDVQRTVEGGGEREGPAEQKRAEARRCGPGSLAMPQPLDAAVSQKLGRRRRIGGGKARDKHRPANRIAYRLHRPQAASLALWQSLL